MKLVTSNENKLREFNRFGLDLTIEKGRDLPEVDSDLNTVAIYKALDAGQGRIVEDTSLDVQGKDIGVNIRWVIENLREENDRRAVWTVILGYNDGDTIYLYRGDVQGSLKASNEKGFGFDPYFVPDGYVESLSTLDSKGEKDNVSARRKAVDAFLNDRPFHIVHISDIPPWEGSYQH